ncbi:MAG TPA: hypothetical protein VGM88_30870 [Kofleriaceae bacterium]
MKAVAFLVAALLATPASADVVAARASAPFDRVEVRRTRAPTGPRGGEYQVALRWHGTWALSIEMPVDDVPSKTCAVGAGRLDRATISALTIAGHPAVLVDLAVEQVLLNDCLSGTPTPAEERREIEAPRAAFYSARGAHPNGHVFIVCGIVDAAPRCTAPLETHAEKSAYACDLGSTLAIATDELVETCRSSIDPPQTIRYPLSSI